MDCDWDSSGPVRPAFQLEFNGDGPDQLVICAPEGAGRIGRNAQGDAKQNFFASGKGAAICNNLARSEDSLLAGVGRRIVTVSGSWAGMLSGGEFGRRLSQFYRAARLKTDSAVDGLSASERQ